MPRVPWRIRLALERIDAAVSATLCRVGVHAWAEFTTVTGAGVRQCSQCPKRQFLFSGKWKDVPHYGTAGDEDLS